MPDRPTVHDPVVLRAIAHPVRNRILHELAAQGSLRAADVATDLSIPANQASFHLRQLAKYGLVEEDPAAARDRRDRVWRLTSPDGLQIDLNGLETTSEGQAAGAVFRRSAAQWGHVVIDHAYARHPDPDTHRSLMETALRLTQDEARQLSQDLADVIDSWRARTLGRDLSRRTYLYLGVLQPPPGGGPDPADPESADPEPAEEDEPR